MKSIRKIGTDVAYKVTGNAKIPEPMMVAMEVRHVIVSTRHSRYGACMMGFNEGDIGDSGDAGEAEAAGIGRVEASSDIIPRLRERSGGR